MKRQSEVEVVRTARRIAESWYRGATLDGHRETYITSVVVGLLADGTCACVCHDTARRPDQEIEASAPARRG